MHFSPLFLLGAAGLSLVNGKKCGTSHQGHEQREMASRLASHETKRPAAKYDGSTYSAASPINIEVYMHSVSATEKGLLSDQDFQKQFDVIADRFGPYDITFGLKNISRTVNPKWSNASNELPMKSYLRQGDYRSLNLYFVDFIVDEDTDETLGQCTFPKLAPEGSDEFAIDGCMVVSSVIPDGPNKGYDQGLTAVHEIGHWFGLAHTFYEDFMPEDEDYDLEVACADPGDGVADTPAQASQTDGCPASRDSCKSQPGPDPIHNYMDYSFDICLTEFTTGQIKRLNAFWTIYRETWPDTADIAEV